MNVKCTIITIGDELLIGQTIDTNSAFIAQKLNEIGIKIHRRIAISDDKNEIISSIQSAWETCEIVITTGGLGPTKDDITKKSLAEFFEVGMKRDEQTYQHVKAFFEARNRPFLISNEAQADVPENCEVLFNSRGTAPGMWFDFKGKFLISLPGVPFEMEFLTQTYVVSKLKSKFDIPSLYYSHIQTFGIGESFIADQIADIESSLPESISLAYLPSPMSVNLRLSGNISNQNEINRYASEIKGLIADHVYGTNTIQIEEKIIQTLKSKNSSLCLVESCTGGYLSHLITNISGSSEVYKGGWNVYSDEFKIKELDVDPDLISKYTSVSPEVAIELVQAAIKKTGSTYGISVVGYLEKYQDNKAHAYIAYGSAENIKTKFIDLFYPRVKSKEAIARMAFCSLYKEFFKI